MAIVVLRLADAKQQTQERPKSCTRCEGERSRAGGGEQAREGCEAEEGKGVSVSLLSLRAHLSPAPAQWPAHRRYFGRLGHPHLPKIVFP